MNLEFIHGKFSHSFLSDRYLSSLQTRVRSGRVGFGRMNLDDV